MRPLGEILGGTADAAGEPAVWYTWRDADWTDEHNDQRRSYLPLWRVTKFSVLSRLLERICTVKGSGTG